MRQQYHARLVGTDTHVWDVRRLVELSAGLPVTPVSLDRLRELDENWWYDGADAAPTPRSISAHLRLVLESDLRHPILLCSEGRLMDGMHRAVKAVLEQRATIAAVRFPVTPEPDYINAALEDLPYGDDG